MDRIEVIRTVLGGMSTGIKEGNLGRLVDLAVEQGLVDADLEFVPANELATAETTYRGRDGFLEFSRMWTEDFDDWSVVLESAAHAPGDRVVAIMRQQGTGRGSGIQTELRHGAICDFDGGRVTRIQLFVDPDEAFRAAGVGP